MLGTTPEVTMRSVRGALALLWLVLIISLFWDPWTPIFTAASSASPFHLTGREVMVQARVLEPTPYPMGARIFWTLALPLVPVFLMLFGHEAWRRICPLSFFTQLPAYLGIQRRSRKLNRATGRINVYIPVIGTASWVERNHWYLQFALLALGVGGRILFYNAERHVLAGLFLGVILCAVLVGFLFGGKTWCQYFCPISVVQKIYTQPRGLFESQAHGVSQHVSQSMCRRPSAGGDQSSCVGCARVCPDIDLERHHWQHVEQESRAFVYYGFFGLVFAFYTYYWWYAGNWDYYFSGAWTHESDQIAQLLHPGFWLNGRPLPIPKLLAVPLYFALCIAGSWLLGAGLERVYIRWRRHAGSGEASAVLRHHCLMVCAFMTFNLFYVFAGRPNLLLLPVPAVRIVDAALLFISSVWLMRGLRRSPRRYRSESLRNTLLNTLKGVCVDLRKLLDGRAPEELEAEEVYLLAKTLPEFSRSEKHAAYRRVVRETLENGGFESSDTLRLLRDVRAQLDLSEQEHSQVLAELGVADRDLLDPERQLSAEQTLRTQNYRSFLGDVAADALRRNRPFADHLRAPEVDARVRQARAEYRINDEQHAEALRSIAGTASPVLARAEHLLREITERTVLRHHLQAHVLLRGRDSARLLTRLLQERRDTLSTQMMAILALGEPGVDMEIAQALHLLAGDLTPTLCVTADIPAPLTQALREVLSGTGANPTGRDAFRFGFGQSDTVENLLARAASDPDPWITALALQALAVLDAGRARDLLERSNVLVGTESWLREEVGQLLEDGTPTHSKRCPGKLELLAWLAGLEPFAGVRLEVLRMLLPELRFQTLPAGDYLCRQHDPAADIYLIYRGAVSAWRRDGGDGQQRQVGSLGPGQVAGEVSVLLQRTRNATLRADAGGAAIVAINGRALRRLSQDHPNIAEYLLDRAVGHLQTFIGETEHGVAT